MSNTSDKLVASLLSAATTVKIHTREDLIGKTLGEGGPTPVDLVHLHSILLKRGPVTDTRCSDKEGIVIKTLTGRTVPIDCSLTVTVEHLKTLISNIEGIPVDQQRLVFTGKQLEDHRQLSDYNITDGSTLHMILRLRGGGEVIYVDYKFRAPKFDYDFRNIDDSGVEFRRGGLVYKRPIGTIRIALDVMNRYGDNNWLGVKGRATKFSDVPGEWAVSYHGTGKNNARSIAEDGFLLCKGQRFRFGHGIYSTPDFAVALRYAETFTHENEQYKFVVQNRVNPQTVKRVPASVTGVGEYWITEKEIDIRPYGFCFVKC